MKATSRVAVVEYFCERAGACGSITDLRLLLADAAHEMGFRYFALLHHSSLGCDRLGLIRIENYPAEWERELVRRAVSAGDPIHQASSRTNVGFLWADIADLLPLSGIHEAILGRARHFGISNGFTVPANVPGEPVGSCSFSGRSRDYLSPAGQQAAELIGGHAFRAARRICGYGRGLSRPHLSRRELECLRLVAAGKTNWEIAVILGLSADTVHQYIKRARAAYDVATRTQLVVHGLRDAWIGYDDVIARGGKET